MEDAAGAAPIPEAARAVRELLRLLVKAQKALRLYEGTNVVSDRLANELFAKLSEHLSSFGPIELSIRETTLQVGESVVYESADRNDSLAFLLFRDGIRRLSILPALAREELHGLLQALNRVSVLANDQDDLVTLFWEQDFKAIHYQAVEELSGESPGPRLQDQLATGALGVAAGETGSAPPVRLDDLEQPVAVLPIEACLLSESETDSLRAELVAEEKADLSFPVVELAIELVLLEPSPEEQKSIASHLLRIVDRLLDQGALRSVQAIFDHLSGLASMVFRDSSPIGLLYRELRAALAQPERIEPFLTQVDKDRSLSPAELTAYLARLGVEATIAWIPVLPRLKSTGLRRAAADALLALGNPALMAIDQFIPANGQPAESALLKELLPTLRRTPGEGARPLLERLLGVPDPQIRREAVSALGHFRGEELDPLWLQLLNDPDPEIRSQALTALVLTGRSELAQRILRQSIGSPTFDGLPLLEKRRRFVAVVKLGGEQALDTFAELLRPAKRWFASRRAQEMEQAAAHGLRAIGTERARQLLKEIAASGDRWVRAACLAELEAD